MATMLFTYILVVAVPGHHDCMTVMCPLNWDDAITPQAIMLSNLSVHYHRLFIKWFKYQPPYSPLYMTLDCAGTSSIDTLPCVVQ